MPLNGSQTTAKLEMSYFFIILVSALISSRQNDKFGFLTHPSFHCSYLSKWVGHGSRVRDQDGDEDDGYDETLVPVDFQRSGQIRDDDIFKILVQPLRAGVTMTCLMDCCHSGTVLDLPYRFTADGDVMQRNDRFQLFDSPEGALAAACCLFALLSCLLDV